MKLRSLNLAEADKFNTWFVIPSKPIVSKPIVRDTVDWVCECGLDLDCTGFFLNAKGIVKELCPFCGTLYKVTSRYSLGRYKYKVWRF